ncbi:hypothetical protein [Pedobacter mendelii]|nr:hypothetical protein [Pedobacter mendelii]
MKHRNLKIKSRVVFIYKKAPGTQRFKGSETEPTTQTITITVHTTGVF